MDHVSLNLSTSLFPYSQITLPSDSFTTPYEFSFLLFSLTVSRVQHPSPSNSEHQHCCNTFPHSHFVASENFCFFIGLLNLPCSVYISPPLPTNTLHKLSDFSLFHKHSEAYSSLRHQFLSLKDLHKLISY